MNQNILILDQNTFNLEMFFPHKFSSWCEISGGKCDFTKVKRK